MFPRASVALLILIAAAPAAARPTPRLHFERIGAAGGPPPAVITALHQDRRGFLWVGSRNGLILFDGYSYTTFQYDPSDRGSLSDSTIRTIYEDRDGTLWIGTNTGGLNRFDAATRSFVHYRHDSSDPHTLSHDSVYAILRDHRGRLWVGTQKGLNRLDPGSNEFVRILAGGAEGLTVDYIMALTEDRSGRLWVGTLGGGLCRWDDDRGHFDCFSHDRSDANSLREDQVTALLEDDAGYLWVGTLHGLSRMDPDRKAFKNVDMRPAGAGSAQEPVITCLAAEAPKRMWVGTHGNGLAELDTATLRFRVRRHDPGQPDSISEDRVIALLADRAGALWIGTWGGGLERVSHASQRFGGPGDGGFPPAGVPDGDVTTMLRARGGKIWIGTRTGYLVRFDPDNGRYETFLRAGRGGVSRTLLALQEDRQGRIWVGASPGLVRLDPRTRETRQWEHDPADPRSIGPGFVSTVLEDRSGHLWIGTGEGGLDEIDGDGKVVRRFVHDPADPSSLSDDYVTTLLEDRNGTLWIGTRSGGLDELDPATGKARRFLPAVGDPSSLGHHHVSSLLEDSSGHLWVGTVGGGLSRIESSPDGRIRFDRVTEHDGLIDDDVMGLLEDDDGSLWITTRRGLSRFDPAHGLFTSLFVSDGLPSAEFEPHAVARGDDLLYFGTVRGLVVLPAGTAFETPRPSPVVIRAIRTASGDLTDRQAALQPDRLELPYGAWFSIEAAVLDYVPERQHAYAYRFEDDWIDIGSRREITFSALRPGKHTLRVRGRNAQGVWNETGAPLQVTVVPPFWMTLPFRLSMVAVLAALAFGAHWRRTSVLEKRNRELVELHRQREKARQDLDDAYQRLRRLTRRLEMAKEDERRRIARELHDEMGPSLTAVIIDLQLLPTQGDSTVLTRKIQETVGLVDRMIQRIREISLDLRPPLIDELGLVPALAGYLESVSERTGIEIRMRGDKTLDRLPEHVPMTAFRVVQEAVTNVVRHAGASHVDVTVRRNGSRLDLSIEDDGKGFEVGETMERAASGRALGLLGMQERVSMLQGEIEIASTPGQGTKIHVGLPLSEVA